MELLTGQQALATLIVNFRRNTMRAGREALTVGFIRSRVELLEKYWMKFQQGHSELLRNEELQNEPYFTEDSFTSVELQYSTALGFLYDEQARLLSESAPLQTAERSNTIQQAHLPKIQIPTFSGRRDEWESFRDLFRSMIHTDTNLTPVQKLFYLKGSVRGEAEAALDGIRITEAGYTTAWNFLLERYDNERLLVHDHMSVIASTQPLKAESASGLQALLDDIVTHRDALTKLDCPVQNWDAWFVFFAVRGLDARTNRDWQDSLGRTTAQPMFEDFAKFIRKRINTLTAVEHNKRLRDHASTSTDQSTRAASKRMMKSLATSAKLTPCPICSAQHYVGHCIDFLAFDTSKRRETAGRHRLCLNCLRPGHFARNCPSKMSCTTCHSRHHTLLHDVRAQKRTSSDASGRSSKTTASSQSKRPHLSTRLTLEARDGRLLTARTLIDPCSETSLATATLIRRLGLPGYPTNVVICDIGGHEAGHSRRTAALRIHPRDDFCPFDASVLVVRNLAVRTPQMHAHEHDWTYLEAVRNSLADPDFTSPNGIDVLLGAEVYGRLMLPGILRSPLNTSIAQQTILGWVVTGSGWSSTTSNDQSLPMRIATFATQRRDQLTPVLRRFWEIEDVRGPVNLLSSSDQECERLYKEGCSRDNTGRYTVRLPFESATQEIGETLSNATRVLGSVRRRMSNDTLLSTQYTQFMDDYEKLGHMRAMSPASSGTISPVYYIPHHGIWRTADTKSKLRVVFNASKRSTSGISLNQMLHKGPKLQADLPRVLLRWRLHRFVMCTDIEMMYRQINVDERDLDYQRIVWRREGDPGDTHFQLLTVTYGMACAPYLALRTLHQLSRDEESRFPDAARVIRDNTYVDDILSGADDVSSAELLRDQLISLSSSGGFHLKKWASNHPPLIETLPQTEKLRPSWHDFETAGPIKTLGVSWDPIADEFRFETPQFSVLNSPTKRQVLATIARLFDPVGWLSPVTIVAKVLMQDLWRDGLDWDQNLPPQLASRWSVFQSDLPTISSLKVPRWLGLQSSDEVELHIFADASKIAYAASVYSRIKQPGGVGLSRLLMAKTRVAPIKTVSIPRLELCAALLATQLACRVAEAFGRADIPIHAWSDSQTAPAWIKSDPSRWPVFVANRVAEIQSTSLQIRWGYVPSSENPADIASRGLDAHGLASSALWWDGPFWLSQPSERWPQQPTHADQPCVADGEQTVISLHDHIQIDILGRFSQLSKMLNVIARCLRWRISGDPNERFQPPYTPEELNRAYLGCARYYQRLHFAEEIEALAEGRQLSRRNRLVHLTPSIDGAGVLRVGGRLKNSALPYEEQHPVILPKDCRLSLLTIDWAHQRCLHGGFQLTYSCVMRRAWIVRGRVQVKAFIRSCVICARIRAQTSSQLMGSLPAERVTPSRPFSRCGLDYAGPFSLKTSRGRGRTIQKGYVALFVCLSTKAVHLEIVGDLTTSSFLGAFRRFAGRRGVPSEVWSDNATTFHGADGELRSMLREAEIDFDLVANSLAKDGTAWKFIPPAAPYFGGLWEAAVKSAKAHMKRVLGDRLLTYEELNTFLIQVEACMNSRPLTPITGEPDDLQVLTPGHFLVGSALNQVPGTFQPEAIHSPCSHWRLVQAMRDHFWSRWARDYLHSLQQRSKWVQQKENFKENDLVLIIDSSLLRQGRWPLGRIIEAHPGQDGLVRVATVRTAFGTYRRPITKLCRLPICDQESDRTQEQIN